MKKKIFRDTTGLSRIIFVFPVLAKLIFLKVHSCDTFSFLFVEPHSDSGKLWRRIGKVLYSYESVITVGVGCFRGSSILAVHPTMDECHRAEFSKLQPVLEPHDEHNGDPPGGLTFLFRPLPYLLVCREPSGPIASLQSIPHTAPFHHHHQRNVALPRTSN